MSPTDMQARLAALEAENKALRERLEEWVFHNQRDQNWIREATELMAEAKRARDDESWAHLHAVPILRRSEVWVAEHFDGHRTLVAEAPTIASALRALRAKVEGGAR